MDFNRIIRLKDKQDKNEREKKWGSASNATDTQIFFKRENAPKHLQYQIFFNTNNCVSQIAKKISSIFDCCTVYYEYCDENSIKAGCEMYEGGERTGHIECRKEERAELHRTLWEEERKYLGNEIEETEM